MSSLLIKYTVTFDHKTVVLTKASSYTTMSNESVQHAILVENRGPLERAIKDNDRHIINPLYNAGLLKADIYECLNDTGSNLSATKKATMIVNSIIDYVELNPDNFDKFLSVLEKSRKHYRDIIKTLRKEFNG